MKKKSFLSGIGAKLALAAVALTTVVFTSCEKEEFNVEPIEQAPASATIFATVYDQTTGENLGTAIKTIAAGENGAIASHSVNVSCPFSSAEYLPVADIEVTVPNVAKGQTIVIPVNFYALKITSAVEGAIPSIDQETIKPGKPETTIKDGIEGKGETEIPYDALVGTKVTNLNEVNTYIENLVKGQTPAARAIDQSNIIDMLKAVVKAYDNQAPKTFIMIQNLEEGVKYQLDVVTETRDYTMDIEAKVDGKIYTIKNVQINEALNTKATLTALDHGHSHGGSNNAGGGAAGAH